jgi:hypothetical protein
MDALERAGATQQLNFSRQTRYFYLVGKLPFASPVLVPSTAVPKLPRRLRDEHSLNAVAGVYLPRPPAAGAVRLSVGAVFVS